jgi:hypothetical protein
MSFSRLFLCLACLLSGATELLAARDGVSVDVQLPHIVRRTFDRAHPPPEMPPLTPPEIGLCVYEFACEMETRVVQPAGFRPVRTARVTATAFTTRLKVTLWTPTDDPAGVLEHEEGHRVIAEFYYRRAREIATRLGREVLATPLAVSGRGRPAIEAALKEVQHRVIQSYLAETLDRCTVAQQRFDEITQHSRARVAVDAAIAQAIADETSRYEQRPASSPPAATRRAPPTRPRSS